MNGCEFYDIKYGKFYCRALECAECAGGSCPFYATKDDINQGRHESHARLRTLPEEQQLKISRAYYGGTRPWAVTIKAY